MSTDGVKIIDGDTAHDTYWGVMDLYDSGANFDTINKEFPLIQDDYFDDFDNEIYVTSCALALWEMGQMTEDKLSYVKSIIDKGACVKEWSKDDEKDGKARQKELDKLWRKISQANTKVRARKKYRKVTNFYFQEDDLLIFKHKDGNYRAVICAEIHQNRGQCNYCFALSSYNSSRKPTVIDLLDKEIIGRRIGSGFDKQTTIKMQPGIERVWKFEGENCNFFFGLTEYLINHKDFVNFKDKFEKVGTLKIANGLKKTGSYSYKETFEEFEGIFDDLDNHIKIFEEKRYPIKVVCDV